MLTLRAEQRVEVSLPGASSGQRRGKVHLGILEENFLACAGHTLNLAEAGCYLNAVSRFDFLEDIFLYFTVSTNRYQTLTVCLKRAATEKNVLAPKKTTTLWSRRADATKALLQVYQEIKQTLVKLSEDLEDSGKSRKVIIRVTRDLKAKEATAYLALHDHHWDFRGCSYHTTTRFGPFKRTIKLLYYHEYLCARRWRQNGASKYLSICLSLSPPLPSHPSLSLPPSLTKWDSLSVLTMPPTNYFHSRLTVLTFQPKLKDSYVSISCLQPGEWLLRVMSTAQHVLDVSYFLWRLGSVSSVITAQVLDCLLSELGNFDDSSAAPLSAYLQVPYRI
ncbi:hypothetical protein J6590_073444 [Homalodisca vitripennis]|nr:hypothetical protein J6590_073444 [Homalodisca vitripennis]